MKELETKHERYQGHGGKCRLLKRLKNDPSVVDFNASADSHGGGGYIRYQVLKQVR